MPFPVGTKVANLILDIQCLGKKTDPTKLLLCVARHKILNGECMELDILSKAFKIITEGQLISKCSFGVFKSPKKTTNFFQDFCPSL